MASSRHCGVTEWHSSSSGQGCEPGAASRLAFSKKSKKSDGVMYALILALQQITLRACVGWLAGWHWWTYVRGSIMITLRSSVSTRCVIRWRRVISWSTT